MTYQFHGNSVGEEGRGGEGESSKVSYHKIADNVIPTPLPKEGHANDHSQAITSGFGVPQLSEVPPGVVITT